MGRSISQLQERPNLSNPRRVARLRAAFWAVEDALLTRTVRRARNDRTTMHDEPGFRAGTRSNPAAANESSAPAENRVRVLRWIFSRGAALLTCELALSDDYACYELRTLASSVPASQTIERFTDVTTAFQRQSALEGSLVSEGWTLDSYESAFVDRSSAGHEFGA